MKTTLAAPGGQALARIVKLALGLSWSEAQRLVKLGKVHVAGELALDPWAQPPRGAEISVDSDRRRPSRRVIPGPELLLLEQDDLLVVEKPSGLATMPPTRTGERTLLEHLPGLLGGRPVWPVHRLDAGTSGLMVFAPSEGAAGELGELLKAHLVRRQYLALVHGLPRAGQVFDAAVPGSEEDSRQSHSARSRVLEVRPQGPLALLRLELETGRRHQLRFHLAGAGFPILGDAQYGDPSRDKPFRPPRLCLHSCSLDLEWRGRPIHQESPWPSELEGLLEATRDRG